MKEETSIMRIIEKGNLMEQSKNGLSEVMILGCNFKYENGKTMQIKQVKQLWAEENAWAMAMKQDKIWYFQRI